MKRLLALTAILTTALFTFPHDLIQSTSLVGARTSTAEPQGNKTRPSALASADFDEDGVPDLVSAYASQSGGIIILHRGNADSIYPNSPQARQRKANGTFTGDPFLSPALDFELPEAPDYICAGDFNKDGHWDLVAAARRSNAIHFLFGDGRAGLGQAQRVELPGRVTALACGDINRADGLIDLVVGVDTGDGPSVVVFEGTKGALTAKPEVIGLPAEATSMALELFDDDDWTDLAVAAGRELLIIRGRDRRLWFDSVEQAKAPAASIDRRRLPFEVTSIEAGNFTPGHKRQVAILSEDGEVHLLTQPKGNEVIGDWKSTALSSETWPKATDLIRARMSGRATDDLIVVDEGGSKLQILKEGQSKPAAVSVEGEPVAVLPMRLNGDGLSDLVILATGGGGPAVRLTEAAAVFTVTTADDSGRGSLRQAILNANTNPGPDSIVFQIEPGGMQTITLASALPVITGTVTIDGTTQPGFAGSPIIELNGNGLTASGLTILNASNSVVRGLVINRFDGSGRPDGSGIVIRGTGAGISNSIIEGNYIGTDVTGSQALPNSGSGVLFDGFAPNSVIGGTVEGARNVISGNNFSGVFAPSIVSTISGTRIEGNFIGTDATGTQQVPNSTGIQIASGRVTIGSTTAGASNLISANSRGVFLNETNQTLVACNFIGTDITGTQRLGNSGTGVIMVGSGNTIAENVISGNGGDGVIVGSSGNNLIRDNSIGTDVTGTQPLGNLLDGVNIFPASFTTAVVANTISDNGGAGVRTSFTSRNTAVRGNFIGTDAFGTTAMGNGIGVHGGGDRPMITDNIISANFGDGVFLISIGAQVQRNLIGTDITGFNPLGNAGSGVVLGTGGTLNNIIGGNGIAYNGGSGICALAGRNNAILSNSIISNGGLGIDLGCDGVTSNDSCDPDTGPNDLQNFPALTSATLDEQGININIRGTFNSRPNTTYTLRFFLNDACDPKGFGEGQTFIGSASVTTDGDCNASFDVTLLVKAIAGQFITATATDANNNTSEFSLCIEVTSPSLSAGLSAAGTAYVDQGVTGPSFSNVVTGKLAVNILRAAALGWPSPISLSFMHRLGRAVLI